MIVPRSSAIIHTERDPKVSRDFLGASMERMISGLVEGMAALMTFLDSVKVEGLHASPGRAILI